METHVQQQRVLPPAKSPERGKRNFANQKFYKQDFSGQDLTHADFRDATLSECDFRNADLSYAIFEGANCFRANFEGARLYRTNFKDAVLAQAIFKPRDCFGVTLTMTCETFDRLQVDPMWFLGWLFLAEQMVLADENGFVPADGKKAQQIQNDLLSIIGAERFARMKAVFEKRAV